MILIDSNETLQFTDGCSTSVFLAFMISFLDLSLFYLLKTLWGFPRL